MAASDERTASASGALSRKASASPGAADGEGTAARCSGSFPDASLPDDSAPEPASAPPSEFRSPPALPLSSVCDSVPGASTGMSAIRLPPVTSDITVRVGCCRGEEGKQPSSIAADRSTSPNKAAGRTCPQLGKIRGLPRSVFPFLSRSPPLIPSNLRSLSIPLNPPSADPSPYHRFLRRPSPNLSDYPSFRQRPGAVRLCYNGFQRLSTTL